MKPRTRLWALMAVLFALGAALWPAGALAQVDNRVGVAFLGGFFLIFWMIFLVFYIYTALALQTIAQKTNTENGWLAWIPIVNVILMCNIANKPVWWILLCFIPIVQIVIFILLWMGIAEARNKPNWWGILMIVPVANLVVPGYLAWAD